MNCTRCKKDFITNHLSSFESSGFVSSFIAGSACIGVCSTDTRIGVRQVFDVTQNRVGCNSSYSGIFSRFGKTRTASALHSAYRKRYGNMPFNTDKSWAGL